jgi:hypothetical protein
MNMSIRIAAPSKKDPMRETPLVPPELLNRVVDYFHPRVSCCLVHGRAASPDWTAISI